MKKVVLGICLILVASAAWGGSLWKDSSVSSCGSDLCSSERLRGTVVPNTGGASMQPFVVQLYAKAGECLRVEVTQAQAGFDLGMTLVEPAGNFRVWQDDDSGGFPNPRIEVNGTPVEGWYTLHISHYAGDAIAGERHFQVKYGRYNAGNSPNCDNPTTSSFDGSLDRSSPKVVPTE